jgi:hypothetical protein
MGCTDVGRESNQMRPKTLIERGPTMSASESTSHRLDAMVRSRRQRGPADETSVACVAYVAARLDQNDRNPFLDQKDAYLETGTAFGSFTVAFITWTKSVGLRFSNRNGVLVALNETGQVVAAADTHVPRTQPRHRVPSTPCARSPSGKLTGDRRF